MGNKYFDDAMKEIGAEIYDKKINQLQEAIRLLEIEKKKHLASTAPESRGAFRDSGGSAKSIKTRIVAAIERTSGPYDIDSLFKEVSQDGGKPITKETFRSTHSRLGKDCFTVVRKGSKKQLTLYQKVEK